MSQTRQVLTRSPAVVAHSKVWTKRSGISSILFLSFSILGAMPLAAAGDEAEEPPRVVLPKIVVTASPEVSFFTVSWKTKGILPFAQIKKAWFSKITPGGPADQAGVKVGDELISLGGVTVTSMSGFSLKMNSLRPREYGTSEEIVFRTAQGEDRTVEFAYERIKKTPPPLAGPTSSPANP